MIEKLKPNEDKVFKTETGECLTIPELWVPKPISDKINELVDAVNELFNRIEPPTVYRVMKERDELIAKHIGEKNKLQTELDRTKKQLEIAIQGIKTLGEYDPYKEPQSIDTIAQDIIEQITAQEQKNHFANASKKVEQKD